MEVCHVGVSSPRRPHPHEREIRTVLVDPMATGQSRHQGRGDT